MSRTQSVLKGGRFPAPSRHVHSDNRSEITGYEGVEFMNGSAPSVSDSTAYNNSNLMVSLLRVNDYIIVLYQ